MHFQLVFKLVLINLFLPYPATCSDDETQSLSQEEKGQLDKFIGELDMSNLPQEYMKDQLYLLRFLKSTEWNVDQAKAKIDAMLKWRADNNIDSIAQEKFDDVAKDFPTYTNGLDKQGRPILESKSLGKWPVANYIAMGKLEMLQRYTIQQLEIVTTKVREQKAKVGAEGPTKAVTLTNVAGLNTMESACPDCIAVYANIAEAIDKYYPYAFEKFVTINAPKAYSYIKSALASVLSKETNDLIKVYTNDRKTWGPYIREFFNEDQIDDVFRDKKNANCSKDDETETISQEQSEILTKFIGEIDEAILPHAYMQAPLFLLRFLKAADWNIEAGKKRIEDMVKWRSENNIDDIISENFDDIIKDFAVNLTGVDKQGRPILETRGLGKWPIAKYIAMGKLDRLKRYTIQQLEIISVKIRERKDKEGEAGPSKAVTLTNVGGLNTMESACPKCLPVYANIAEAIERYYPYMIEKFVSINAPRAYDNIKSAIAPILSKEVNEAIKVFDTNPKNWMGFLQEFFDNNQIDEVFKEPAKKKSKSKFKPKKKHFKKPKKRMTTEMPTTPQPNKGILANIINQLVGRG